MFSIDERVNHVQLVLNDVLRENASRVTVTTVRQQLLINYAAQLGVNVLIRGIRNAADMQYESDLQQINTKLQPNINTMYFISTNNTAVISSSAVKSFVGYDEWESALESYVHPSTIQLLKSKYDCLTQQ